MRTKSFSCVCLGILAFAAHPASAQVLVGPNLEWSYWSSFPKTSTFKSGSGVAVGGYYLIPGLRVGYVFPGGAVAAAADIGIQHESIDDFKYTNIIVEPGVAYAFMSKKTTNPYIGVCAGWHHISEGGLPALTRPLIGVSAGVRHSVAAGHGFIRAEMRYDHFTTTDTKDFVLPQDMVGLCVGADLLISK